MMNHGIKTWPFIVAVMMLASTWVLLRSLSDNEPTPVKKPFAQFPLAIADRWQGRELGMEQRVLNVLKLTDYMIRVYVSTGQAIGNGLEAIGINQANQIDQRNRTPVWLYVGYYGSQRTGATYHSPSNCLPGAGWQFVESEQITFPLLGAGQATINKVLIQKGLDKQVILYWYHDRGRIVASEYWAKAFLVWDAMTKNRTDGALVRISVPVVTSQDLAYQHALLFLQDIWSPLKDYLPAKDTLS